MLETIGLLARPPAAAALRPLPRPACCFSIRDAQGRPVGLGRPRAAGPVRHSPAKYVNSPETPLFSKSHLLYGLDVAREAIRKSRTAMVMEGYTDCIVAHQYGFANAVAVLGTALGESHIRILKRFADRIVLVLDGDEAGQRRANEVLELFVAQQVDLRVLTLPDELDPCDFLQARGPRPSPNCWRTERSTPWTTPFARRPRGIDLKRDIHGASQALERLLAIVAKAPRLRHDTTRAEPAARSRRFWSSWPLFRVDEAEVRRHLTSRARRGRGSGRRARQAGRRPSGSPWQAERTRALRSGNCWSLLLGHPGTLAGGRSPRQAPSS